MRVQALVPRRRIRMVFMLMVVTILAMIVQLVGVQFGTYAPVFALWLEVAGEAASNEVLPERGLIYDRDGNLLATNVPMYYLEVEVRQLTEASQSSSPEPLHPALAAEQASYQALLKLRAREHRVVRSSRQPNQQRPASSASGSQSRAQQQLEQLELTDEEDRYETQSEAATQQEQEQRETLQVLNRLRELARRQADLNKRMKELQSALDEARTEEEHSVVPVPE